MEVVICPTAEEVARNGADCVCRMIQKKPDSVLGLATGSTPVAMYEELIARNQSGAVSFTGVRTFNLDEYIGLPREHSQSYHSFMFEKLFDHIDIPTENVQVPDGSRENPRDVGPEYEKMIAAAGGIDLQVLGIGTNGHIGFNEPTSSLASRTRVKTLTPTTVKDNSRFFADDEFQPVLAITMGIGTILSAKRILLLVTGVHKAEAIKKALEGPITAMCPASALQLHQNVTVFVDEPAASFLEMKDYYQYVRSFQQDLVERYGDPE